METLSRSKTTKQNELRAWKRANGICRDCSQPATHGAYCEKDYNINLISNRESKRRCRKDRVGRCASCNNPLFPFFDDGHTNCTACRMRRDLYIRRV